MESKDRLHTVRQYKFTVMLINKSSLSLTADFSLKFRSAITPLKVLVKLRTYDKSSFFIQSNEIINCSVNLKQLYVIFRVYL